jgi:nicotinate-nucleotide adenylyltransferase
MKIGLFFGSFNPVHIGHMIIAQYFVENTDIDKVWMVVSPQNPFKQKEHLLNEYDRLHLVELAIGKHLNIAACSIEFQLPKPSYTIDTLVYLGEKYPSDQFCLLMGEDNLISLPKWKNAEIILRDYPIFVYSRAVEVKEHADIYGNITRLHVPLLDISSTFIRAQIAAGKDIHYYVPDSVYQYITEMNLYKK